MQDELVGNAESMSNGIRIHRMPLCVRYLCRWTPLGVRVLEMRGVVDEEGWKLSVGCISITGVDFPTLGRGV